MEELIFFAVLIFFSIIESIARSRKQRKGGPLPEVPTEWPPEEQELPRRRPSAPPPRTSAPPSYDEDASFDARLPKDEGRSLEDLTYADRETSYDEKASSEEERSRREASSESMIPDDIWEEIRGIAREARVELPPPRPKPQPRPQRKAPLPQQRRAPQPRARPTAPPPKTTASLRDHPVHLSHAGYGTDPSERARSEQDVLQKVERAGHADVAAVRQQLRSQRGHALRQAFILQEVLGPPTASKPDRFSE